MKKAFIIFLLLLISKILLAVPNESDVTFSSEGSFCYKPGSSSTVTWSVPTGKWCVYSVKITSSTGVVANGGAIDITSGVATIVWNGVGKHKVKIKVVYHSDDNQSVTLPVNPVKKVNLYILKAIKLKSGPDYSPVGTEVQGLAFEIEKNDKIKLKVISDPTGMPASLLTWSGDGVNGNGLTKIIKYNSTGTKNVSVKFDTCELSTKVYVNNNLSTPISDTSVDFLNGKWAHVGGIEFIKLRANAKDIDWVNGKKGVDNIDLNETRWTFTDGFLSNSKGRITKWYALKKGEYNITAEFRDKNESAYSPREDISSDSVGPKVMEKVGGFKVVVSIDVSSSSGAKSSEIDEFKNVTGEKLPLKISALNHKIEAFASAKNTWNNPPKPKDKEDDTQTHETFCSINLTFLLDPSHAKMRGKISCKATSNLKSGELVSEVYDNDLWDGNVELQFTAGLSSHGLGFSVSDKVILAGDSCEATAFTSYGFSSDDMGKKNPKDAKLLQKSSDNSDNFRKPVKKKKSMKHNASSTIIKSKNGAESKAIYQGFLTAKAHATKLWCGSSSAIVGSKIIFNIKNVRYIYE